MVWYNDVIRGIEEKGFEMASFARYTASEEWAKLDLARGYSFREYQFFDSLDEARESDLVEYYGVDAETIAELIHPDGSVQYGFALDGLCGFRVDEDDEIPSYAASAGWLAMYEGTYVGEADGGDGDIFIPHRLLSVKEEE